ncbi:MAG: DUF294 nucleotidyltransferase-like domain-containing protein [Acidobacteriota bacterium]|nr:DUF294 nucleotidyltransferase-like domain-containing protein [Acidobacteriota bacterium]
MPKETLLEPIKEFLKTITAFETLPNEALGRIASNCRIDYAGRDTVLWTQSETPVKDVCFIARGAVELFDEADQDRSHDLLGEGELFGGLSILRNQGLALRGARTVEDCFLYRYPAGDFVALCSRYKEVHEYFTDRLNARYHRSLAALRRRRLKLRDDGESALMHMAVGDLVDGAVSRCLPETSIREAAQIISLSDSGYALIMERDQLLGIVTDRDFRREVVGGDLAPSEPIRALMKHPVVTVESNDSVLDALLIMIDRGISHLAVRDVNGLSGVISALALPQVQQRSPLNLVFRIRRARLPEELNRVQAKLPEVVYALFQEGYGPEHVSRFIAHINDAVLRRLIEFGMMRLGEPPAPFAFLVLGSEGREEQTLIVDQDNAILYADDVSAEDARWFKNLGALVCTWLDEAGYRYCKGRVMAENSNWCRPLSAWKKMFSQWIREPLPDAQICATIFFDFRAVYGDTGLTTSLRDHLMGALHNGENLLQHMAQRHLEHTPPLGFFRNFIVEGKGEHKKTLDIKKTMNFVVEIARLAALSHGIRETHTPHRLAALKNHGFLNETEYEAMRRGYAYMMNLRLQHQEECARTGGVPDNHINPYHLSKLDQDILKAAFREISRLQVRIRRRFLGSL